MNRTSYRYGVPTQNTTKCCKIMPKYRGKMWPITNMYNIDIAGKKHAIELEISPRIRQWGCTKCIKLYKHKSEIPLDFHTLTVGDKVIVNTSPDCDCGIPDGKYVITFTSRDGLAVTDANERSWLACKNCVYLDINGIDTFDDMEW